MFKESFLDSFLLVLEALVETRLSSDFCIKEKKKTKKKIKWYVCIAKE